MSGLKLSPAEQDYLKAIYHLQRRGDGEQVGTVDLAKWLGVTPASVTNMIKKLAEQQLVNHRPYYGVMLTEEGKKATLALLRHHRLLESYLSERLGLPWEEVHAEADRLEHALSEALEDRLDAILGHPTTDPHGAPIPAKDGTITVAPTVPLWQAQPGLVTVAEVEDEDATLLRHLADLGLRPGVRVEVLAKGPFGGPLHIRVDGQEHAVSETVARIVAVVPIAGPDGRATP